MRKVFEEIFAIESDDAIQFKKESLVIAAIMEFKEYKGINIKVTAMLDRTLIPVSIDIGFRDVVHPERVKMDAPIIYAYSPASVVAEKFEAIVSLGYAHSRYKDYYDIYYEPSI